MRAPTRPAAVPIGTASAGVAGNGTGTGTAAGNGANAANAHSNVTHIRTRMPLSKTTAMPVIEIPHVRARDFADAAALAEALALAVAADLRRAIAARGLATLALAGGNTPRRFLQMLSRQTLDWSKVRVLPVDERWVPNTDPRSNERLLREHLLQGEAAAAELLPLYRPVETPEVALQSVAGDIAHRALPLDVAVLGMGEDGHVASLFPDLVRRDVGLTPAGRAPVLAIRTAAAPEPRLTLTLSAIFTAPALYLHIEGAGKRRVLADALADDVNPGTALPVHAFVTGAPTKPALYWCP